MSSSPLAARPRPGPGLDGDEELSFGGTESGPDDRSGAAASGAGDDSATRPTRDTGTSHRDLRRAVGLTVLLPVYAAVVGLLVPSAAGVFGLAVLAIGGLLLLTRRSDELTATTIGLGRDRLRGGVWVGASAAAAIALVGATAIAVVSSRGAGSMPVGVTASPAASLSPPTLAIRLLVVIPIGTAVFEELAFRGVLLASWRRVTGTVPAVLVTSAAFGLWHVVPELHRLAATGQAPGDLLAAAVAVAPGVAATASASAVVLCPLRIRTGSLAAPILVHAAVNDTVLLVVWLLAR